MPRPTPASPVLVPVSPNAAETPPRAVDGGAPWDGPDGASAADRRATVLMARFRDSRSPAAFEALYALTRPSVLSWIQGLLRRSRLPLDPFELLQDTFVNVYRYPTAFRDEHDGSFRVWVRTIAGNLVRRAGVPRRRVSFQEMPDGLQEPEDACGTPAWRAEVGEEVATLRCAWLLFLAHYARAWSALAPRDKEALRLVEVEGASYAAAGARLGVGRSNMKMIVFRARQRLARRMRDAMGGGAAPRASRRLAGAA